MAAAPVAARPRLLPRAPRWWRLVAVAVVALTVLSAFAQSTLAVYRVEREAAALEARVRALRARNAQLREEIRLLHDPAAIERIAREELGLVKPGEVAVLLVREDPPLPPPAPPAPRDGPLDRLGRWWRRVVERL